MSRIGKKPIPVPAGVKVRVEDGVIHVQGPKGALSQRMVPGIELEQRDGKLYFTRKADDHRSRAYHGLMRALTANMVTGVTRGFEKQLEVQGVGYKAELKGRELVLTLGYSHPVRYPIPEGIDITVERGAFIKVSGIDKEKVGQVAADIRAFRPPDHYKGKGIRYKGEKVRLKVGKSAG